MSVLYMSRLAQTVGTQITEDVHTGAANTIVPGPDGVEKTLPDSTRLIGIRRLPTPSLTPGMTDGGGGSWVLSIDIMRRIQPMMGELRYSSSEL